MLPKSKGTSRANLSHHCQQCGQYSFPGSCSPPQSDGDSGSQLSSPAVLLKTPLPRIHPQGTGPPSGSFPYFSSSIDISKALVFIKERLITEAECRRGQKKHHFWLGSGNFQEIPAYIGFIVLFQACSVSSSHFYQLWFRSSLPYRISDFTLIFGLRQLKKELGLCLCLRPSGFVNCFICKSQILSPVEVGETVLFI